MLKIAICDDEQDCINDVEKHLKLYSFEYGIEFQIYKFLRSDDILKSVIHFDIAFLDVEMDGINGFGIGNALQKINPEVVLIFVSAYDQYLDAAFDMGSIRFFNKPIESERFYLGLERAITKIDKTEVKFYLDDKNGGSVAIQMKDIVFVEIKGRKTRVVTKNNEYISKENIKSWKERLNKSYFISPHNSYIVNINYITYYCKEHIMLDDKYRIDIAYSRRTDFKRQFAMLMED